MRIDRFISEHLEEVLAEWEAFARTLGPATDGMSGLALRDHAKEILQAVALDIKARQNAQQQQEKSQGLVPDTAEKSAASIHGALRQASEFSLIQLSSEFRALRATVLRLWLPQVKQITADTVYDMIRFNEAIDQALAESVVTFSARAEHAREIFLAILGHDLRAPLSTMALSGQLLSRAEVPTAEVSEIGARIRRSSRLMSSMVNDLLGYTRTQLGSGMPIAREETDIKRICESAIEDASATHPANQFDLRVVGEVAGCFDNVRLHQLFANLLINGAQYGDKERPITVTARGEADAITVDVTNFGPAIPEASLQSIFRPLVQLANEDTDDTRPKTSLGLGLFVAREIAIAHGGEIAVTSDESKGTTFTVRLPRAVA
jgi:signal transduction histidine kinase